MSGRAIYLMIAALFGPAIWLWNSLLGHVVHLYRSDTSAAGTGEFGLQFNLLVALASVGVVLLAAFARRTMSIATIVAVIGMILVPIALESWLYWEGYIVVKPVE
jgi:hypothetical protein